MATVRARYERGVLTPLAPLDIQEGAEVTVSVEADAPTPNGAQQPADKPDAPAKSGETLLEMVDRLHASYPPDMWEGLPKDLAKNKKHYLYGHPKEED